MSVQNFDKVTRARAGRIILGKLAILAVFAASVFAYYLYFFR